MIRVIMLFPSSSIYIICRKSKGHVFDDLLLSSLTCRQSWKKQMVLFDFEILKGKQTPQIMYSFSCVAGGVMGKQPNQMVPSQHKLSIIHLSWVFNTFQQNKFKYLKIGNDLNRFCILNYVRTIAFKKCVLFQEMGRRIRSCMIE